MFSFALGLFACKDEEAGPILSLEGPPAITVPSANASYVLTSATEDDLFETITWTPVSFNLTNLEAATYRLQMDKAGNNFASPTLLSTGKTLNFGMTVGALNNKLLSLSFNPDEAANLELRVVANLGDKLDDIFSNVVPFSVTPYLDQVVVKPIYLLGDGSLAGWDNLLALPMTYVDGGKYEIITTLGGGGKYIKFISSLGAWAPQWGTDASGLPESGALVLRPTEAEPDPPAIPTPAVASQYKIIADTANLTYEVFEYGDIWLLGDATLAGWDNTLALPFTKVSEGKYTIITTLATAAGQYWKIIDERGAWAPQWGMEAGGLPEGGVLSYRPTEDVTDPPAIPAPATAGTYKIDVDIVNLTYTVTPQ